MLSLITLLLVYDPLTNILVQSPRISLRGANIFRRAFLSCICGEDAVSDSTALVGDGGEVGKYLQYIFTVLGK